MIVRMLAGLVGIGLLAGCCTCESAPWNQNSKVPLPAPITAAEQIERLDARVAMLPRLRAETVLRGVELHMPDKNGKDQSQNVEGTLLLRQEAGSGAAGGVNVMLMGKAFDQQVFQAGRNATTWWFILLANVNAATVGDSRRAIDWSDFGRKGSSGILRADLVPDLLGLTRLAMNPSNPTSRAPANEALAMQVDDLRGVNDLFVETVREMGAGGWGRGGGGVGSPVARVWIRREIVVDRRTGDIEEVKLFDTEGILVVRSLLRDYRAVSYTGENNDAAPAATGNAPAPAVPRVPYRVEIQYPSQRVSVSLTFDKVSVPAKIGDIPFQTPDFGEQGLEVHHAD